jgi:Zn-finger nucleic acid-binding protein
MNCPACGRQLVERTTGGITVDVCDGGCGGIWFDHLELLKVDEPHESAGAALLGLERAPDLAIDENAPRHCPRCEGMVLFRHFYSVKRQVQVDECHRCGGIWLDVGELAAIRSQYRTEEERQRAADAYFDDVFGGELTRIRAAGKAQEEQARRIAHAFRFLCPSFWIPGKQKWGAF